MTMKNWILWVLDKGHHANLVIDQKMLLIL